MPSVIHDLIEISGPNFQSVLTFANGRLLGTVFDDVVKSPNPSDPPEEYNTGDTVTIGGISYEIQEIYHPDDDSSSITHANGTVAIADRSDDDADLLILEVSDGTVTRYFIVPADRLGDMPRVSSVTLGRFKDAAGNDATLTGTQNNTVSVCFARGVRIETAVGAVPVERLSVGTLVRTRDRGLQPIRWIGARKIGQADLTRHPNLRPIRIRAGALGQGTPLADLVVSPQHRLLLRSRRVRQMSGSDEVLAAAKQLVLVDGIETAGDMTAVEYWHFLLDTHEIVFANGAEAETLYAGPQALRSVDPCARDEILSLLPQMCRPDHGNVPVPARPFLSGRQTRRLARTHRKAGNCLVEPLRTPDGPRVEGCETEPLALPALAALER